MQNKIYLGKAKRYTIRDGIYKVSSDNKYLEAEYQGQYRKFMFWRKVKEWLAYFREWVAFIIAPEVFKRIVAEETQFKYLVQINKQWQKDTRGRARCISKLQKENKMLSRFIKELYSRKRDNFTFIMLPELSEDFKKIIR